MSVAYYTFIFERVIGLHRSKASDSLYLLKTILKLEASLNTGSMTNQGQMIPDGNSGISKKIDSFIL